ncbi:MAG: hypothetical protein AB7P14_17430 [Blastocatellales bacterium]
MLPEYKVRVQVITTADDDGGNAATTTASQVTARLATVNKIFAAARVKFVFDEIDDFLKVNSTLLNRDFTVLEPPNVSETKWDHEPLSDADSHGQARWELAGHFSGKLVLFFRDRKEITEELDAQKKPTGFWIIQGKNGGSTSTESFYVNMSMRSGANDLAHEIGHYLQLPHPFVEGVKTVADAREKIKRYVADGHSKNEGLNALDGDRGWVLDTPADARGQIFEEAGLDICGSVGQIPITVTFSDNTSKTYTLAPDRSLVMSYFKGCPGDKIISPQQARRVRDGLELRVRHDLISVKPSFSCAIRRGGAASAGAVSEIDLTLLRADRVVTAVRDGSGELALIVWDIEQDASKVTRRGTASAGAVGRIAVCGLGLNMVATAICDSTNKLKVITWRVQENGDVTRLEEAATDGEISDVAASLIASNVMATAVQTASGVLRLDIWKVNADGTIRHVTTGSSDGKINVPKTGLSTPRLQISSIGETSILTYIRDEGHDLKTILWRYGNGELERRGHVSLNTPSVGDIVGRQVAREVALAAIQDKVGNLKVVAYRCPEDGKFIEQGGMGNAGAVADVSICRLGTQMAVTGVKDGAGHLKPILWQVTNNGGYVVRLDSAKSEERFSRLAMCQTNRDQFATALRDGDGNLKVIAWRVEGTLA